MMFHNVRILSADGKTKKVIGSRELSNRHWKKFAKMEGEITLTTSGQPNVPSWLKKKLDMEYPDYHADATCYH